MTDPSAQFTPRAMLRMMEQRPRPTNFLAGLLVKERNTTNKTIIEIDKVFGNQVIAQYVDRNGGPTVVGKGGFKNFIHPAPYLYDQIPIKPSDLDIRNAGTTVYDDPSQYIAGRFERWLADLEDRFLRREEQQIAEAIQTGKVHVEGKDVDFEVDYGMDPNHLISLTTTDRWDDGGSAGKKLGMLEDWAQMIEDKGAPGPDTLVGDRGAMNLLLADSGILATLDNRRVERGEINIQLIRGQRATYLGTLRGSGLDIDLFSYQGMYEDVSTGTAVSTRFMNKWTVSLLSTQQDFRFHYAKIENHLSGDFIGQRFPNDWTTQDGKNRYLSMESSPLAGFHQPDAVVSVVVTDTP